MARLTWLGHGPTSRKALEVQDTALMRTPALLCSLDQPTGQPHRLQDNRHCCPVLLAYLGLRDNYPHLINLAVPAGAWIRTSGSSLLHPGQLGPLEISSFGDTIVTVES